MPTSKATLTLSAADRAHIDSAIQSGQFVGISDYVRSLIRRDRETITETPQEIAAIRARLKKAEQSVEREGWVTDSGAELLTKIKTDIRTDGEI